MLNIAAAQKDPVIYVRNPRGQEDFVAGGFWVDNLVGIGSRKELDPLAASVNAKYGITGFGEVKWVLGMLLECDHAARMILISQDAFINSVLAWFHLTDTSPLSMAFVPSTHLLEADCPATQEEKDKMSTWPYRELVGALAWLTLGTQPDIAFAASLLTCFGHNPGCAHWEVAKCVLCYLKGTRGWCLMLGGSPPQIAAFTDMDWGSNCNNW